MGQRLQKDPGVADANVKPREVQRVGVLGAGIMGAGIAGAHVRRGIPVMLLDAAPQALEKGSNWDANPTILLEKLSQSGNRGQPERAPRSLGR